MTTLLCACVCVCAECIPSEDRDRLQRSILAILPRFWQGLILQGFMCYSYISSRLSGITDNFSRHLGQYATLQSSRDSKILAIRKHDSQTAEQQFLRLLKSCSIVRDISVISLIIGVPYIFLADSDPIVQRNLQGSIQS